MTKSSGATPLQNHVSKVIYADSAKELEIKKIAKFKIVKAFPHYISNVWIPKLKARYSSLHPKLIVLITLIVNLNKLGEFLLIFFNKLLDWNIKTCLVRTCFKNISYSRLNSVPHTTRCSFPNQMLRCVTHVDKRIAQFIQNKLQRMYERHITTVQRY